MLETFERRLWRFTFGSPREPFLNLVNSIANFVSPELTNAFENGQVYLFFLGSHAIIQTVSKNIYAKTGPDGTLYYLKNFVDGSSPGTDFSTISHVIHSMRNVVAHQVLSCSMHNIVIDEKLDCGWKRSSGEIIINWYVYAQHFLDAFSLGGRIYDWDQHLSPEELIVRQYQFICRFLELHKSHDISRAIVNLKANMNDEDDLHSQVKKVQKLICAHYGITETEPIS
jgi:hypothetical protein